MFYYTAIIFLLSLFTIYVGYVAKFTTWDSIVLMVWIAWPLYLTTILIDARHKSRKISVWRFQALPDFMLIGAFIPLLIGLVLFNISVLSNIEEKTVKENFLFIGYFSVKLWLSCAIGVFIAWVTAKIVIRKRV